MKKIVIALSVVFFILPKICLSMDSGIVPNRCECKCSLHESTFYRGQTVWDVVSGEGIIKSIKQDSSILYTIYVAFPGGAVRVYTMDGKHFETDLLPSLYPYKVKIIEDR